MPWHHDTETLPDFDMTVNKIYSQRIRQERDLPSDWHPQGITQFRCSWILASGWTKCFLQCVCCPRRSSHGYQPPCQDSGQCRARSSSGLGGCRSCRSKREPQPEAMVKRGYSSSRRQADVEACNLSSGLDSLQYLDLLPRMTDSYLTFVPKRCTLVVPA
ncbi:hypothetical protein BV22DRAFT_274280 [Leucogyrophana mollusca]|uniref:Uncharacterized protein n=1 Tax=Leucogyrophana mollusca TaxID=85980 RepID=A0ACB8BND1_9AGAM|nr:hypothetical protein BV22DRAFT_274280 [Leucogyrophana mollusca]